MMDAGRAQPLVHVVTPVHDEEPYLARCIESVLEQSHDRWTMTVVNNGSTDRSLEIALAHAARDPRIQVHDNERFLSQIDNINAALLRVSDEATYCQLVLGDDWLFPTCIQRMVEVAETSSRIGLVSAYVATESDVQGVGLPRDRTVYSGSEVCASQLGSGGFYFGSPTSQLWRAEIVRGRRPFYRTDFHGDTDACYDVLADWDFGFVHEILTFRRTANDSVTRRMEEFNPHFTDGLVMLANYGERYLSPEASSRRMTDMLRTYDLFLGACTVRGAERAFWEHHRAAGAAMHRPLTPSRRAWCATKWLADTALNPKRTIQRIARKMRGGATGDDPVARAASPEPRP